MVRPAMSFLPSINLDQGPERVSVLLPLPLAGCYTYARPPHLDLGPGDIVAVPLGGRLIVGVVWDDPPDMDVAVKRLKPVADKFDVPPMLADLRRFVDWLAAYTLNPPGAVLRMCLSSYAALEPTRGQQRTGYVLGGPPPEKLTDARRRVIHLLADGPARTLQELCMEAGCGAGVVKGLVTAGTLQAVVLPPPVPFEEPDAHRPGPDLSPDQAEAAAHLVGHVMRHEFSVALLHGVTGAGKTEVYFEAVAAALRDGRQVLVLLPEIALTAQWLDRFEGRFGVRPAEWHSDLTGRRRRETWRAISQGQARVVVGARSALFLPYRTLGLIIVDEEHDASFKQEDGVIYHARDMAVVRAKMGDLPVVLSSATPSLETLWNCDQGRYERYPLTRRHADAVLPEIAAIDLRRDPPPNRQRFLSPPLIDAVRQALERGEQAMLFLNRRGYAPLTLCGACGHRLQCPHCTAWLVEHRYLNRLMCHHCGFQAAVPDHCPHCQAEARFKPCGPGVERVMEEAAEHFPDARIALMASDTLTSPRAASDMVQAIGRAEFDLVVGTQIVAKGHHFPLLTVVGVIDADLGLAGGDLRAAERTHQLLTQVAGRAGRAQRPGKVLLQTYTPEHPVMQALIAGDADRFIAAEMAARRDARAPPYGRYAALILSGPDEREVAEAARHIARLAPRRPDMAVLGPAPAPLSLLRGRYRYRFLIKAGRDLALQAVLRDWLAPIKLGSTLRLAVDIDPQSFM